MPEHVPTVAELAEMGAEYAVATDWVNDGTARRPKMRATRWRVTDRGHALMGEAMRHNALEARAAGAGDWTQPPSRELGWKLNDLDAAPHEEREEVRPLPTERPGRVDTVTSWADAPVPLLDAP